MKKIVTEVSVVGMDELMELLEKNKKLADEMADNSQAIRYATYNLMPKFKISDNESKSTDSYNGVSNKHIDM
ncbi:MAG: hypothetical protein LKJ25_05975 [Clostridia bacterium]|jgi:hypothetical protein|nr:hypothetical protein [Clostridia bacterium]